MSVFDNSNEIKITDESALPKIAYGVLAVAGASGAVYFGREFANEAFNNSDNLRNAGIALLSATGCTYAVSKLSSRVRNNVERIGARRVFGLGLGVGALTVGMSFFAADRDEGSVTISDDINNTVITDLTDDQDTSENQAAGSSTSTAEWACEIYAPIQRSNGSPENIGSAVALQRFLVAEAGFPENQVNGDAGLPTGDYVDIYQEKIGVDVDLPWGPETCAVSPFGDGDSNTPPSGGWETNWNFYLENIATTE
jgi:hypothetical protein